MSEWYRITAKANAATAEIDIYGQIGESWFEETTSAANFRKDLNGLTAKHLVLNINSPGGSVFDGLAIYNSIQRWKQESGRMVTVNIDGLAASIASVIAMAGDVIRIPRNAMIMIHNASGFAIGDAAQMRKMAQMLDGANQSIASVYQERSGRDLAIILAQMSAETWFVGEEAIENYFATELVDAIELQACFGDECKQRWRNAPHELTNFLPSPVGRGVGEGKLNKERNMDKNEVQALVQDALQAQAVELTAEIKEITAKLGDQLTASTAALQAMAAKYDDLKAQTEADAAAEAGRIEDINGVFAMFDTAVDRPYREHYLALKAECLADKKINYPLALSRITELRHKISAGNVQLPVAGDAGQNDAPDFMQEVEAHMNKHGGTKGAAIHAVAHAKPELHRQYTKQLGA